MNVPHTDGSLTLDNASVQRLMDYNVLHIAEDGSWVVGKWPDLASHPLAQMVRLDEELGLYEDDDALAAAARQGGDGTAPGEAPQSGHDSGNAQTQSRNPV